LTTIVHRILCTINEAAPTTYNIGRTQIETIKWKLKRNVATEAHRTATRAICVHYLGNTATFQALDSNFKVRIPMHPFLGCIGVAPANSEARSSIVPAEFGGNMDAPEVSVGNTLYLRVNVTGALFYFGDGHAAMGDGEVAGSAIEVPMRVRLQFDVMKKKSTGWPRFENDKEIMTTGIYRPVDDAVRIAFTELVAWIHADYGLSDLNAYELLSKVGKIHLTEMVDPNYVVVASVEKKYLPAKIANTRSAASTH
jgi:acetamidase/formamidase